MKMLKYLFVCFLVVGVLGFSAQADLIMVPDPDNGINTIQDAIYAASEDDTIMIAPGNYKGAIIYKKVNIVGMGGVNITEPIFLNPPAPGFPIGFWIAPKNDDLNNPDYPDSGGDGCSISHIAINIVTDDGYGIVGVAVDDVKVDHVVFGDQMFGGIHWGMCDGWEVTHNTFNGGIGMPLASDPHPLDPLGEGSNNNLIALNEFNNFFSGIYMWAGATPFQNNKIVHNKIKAYFGIILEDYSCIYNEDPDYLVHNFIGFNDLRGCENEIVDWSCPPGVLSNNTLSRNLGYQDPNNPNRAVTEPPEDVNKFRPRSIFE